MADFSKFSPNNGGTILDVKDANGRVMSESLIRDTVGWTGKNILKNNATSETVNTVVFTVNADKSIVVNGTPTSRIDKQINGSFVIPKTGNYKYTSLVGTGDVDLRSSVLKNSAFYANDYGEGVDISANEGDVFSFNMVINKAVNNAMFKPMLRLATIPDGTYEPYHDTVNDEIKQINREIGNQNLLPNYAQSVTKDGITFTVNADKSITVSGQTGASATNIYLANLFSLETGKQYILSDGVAVHNTSRFLRLGNATDGYLIGTGTGDNQKFTATSTMTARISVEANTDLSTPITYYPMIREVDNPDTAYTPYAMTNKELTDALTPIEGSFDYTHTTSSTTPSPNTGRTHIFNVGKIAVASLWVSNCTISLGSWQEICRTTLKPKKETVFPLFMGNGRTDYGRIDTNGVIAGFFQNAISAAEVHANFTYILA